MIALLIAAALVGQEPTFDFRGASTSTVVDLAGKQDCSPFEGSVNCSEIADVAGVSPVIYTTAYNEGRMYAILGQFPADNHITMLRAFVEKYGTPVFTTKEWRTRSGSTFTNEVATWTFGDGVLTLESLGYDMNHGAFRFANEANRPAPQPVAVNF